MKHPAPLFPVFSSTGKQVWQRVCRLSAYKRKIFIDRETGFAMVSPMNTTNTLQAQIEEATRIQARHPNCKAIVTESRQSQKARKTWFGFRFSVNESTEIGREIRNEDGSFSVIRAVVG